MRILGVDPGTRRTGIGIIEGTGAQSRLVHAETLRIPETLPLPRRLALIHAALVEAIRRFRPGVLALENVFYAKDPQSMVKIGEARACAMLAASGEGLDVVEYAPARVKQSVTGSGRATKHQVKRMVKTLLRLEKDPGEDGADALAVALCHQAAARNPLLRLREPREVNTKKLIRHPVRG